MTKRIQHSPNGFRIRKEGVTPYWDRPENIKRVESIQSPYVIPRPNFKQTLQMDDNGFLKPMSNQTNVRRIAGAMKKLMGPKPHNGKSEMAKRVARMQKQAA